MATRGERIIAEAKKGVEAKKAEDVAIEERKRREEEEKQSIIAEKARVESEREIRKVQIWIGTGIPELFEEVAQLLEGGHVEYSFYRKTRTRTVEKKKLFGSRYIDEVEEIEQYFICLYTGGQSKHWSFPDGCGGGGWETEPDIFGKCISVHPGLQVTPSMVISQVGSLKEVEAQLEEHMREISPKKGIRFKQGGL